MRSLQSWGRKNRRGLAGARQIGPRNGSARPVQMYYDTSDESEPGRTRPSMCARVITVVALNMPPISPAGTHSVMSNSYAVGCWTH